MAANEERDDRICKYDNGKQAMDFSDALAMVTRDGKPIPKISIGLTQYAAEPHSYVKCFLDAPEALVLCHDLMHDTLQKFGPCFTGSSTQEGGVQSRVFEVAYDDKGRNVGYYIRISNGPGIKTQTGAVMPDKARAAEIAKVQVFIPKDNIRQIAAAVENRIRAYEMLIVANRARAQAKKGE